MQRKCLPLVFTSTALLAGVVGNLVVCWHAWRFYAAVCALPAGAELWMGGRGLHHLAVSFITLIVTVPLSGFGLFFSIKQDRVATGLIACIGTIIALTPFPLACWLDGKIIAATGVALAP